MPLTRPGPRLRPTARTGIRGFCALLLLAWAAIGLAASPGLTLAEQAQLEEDWRKQDGIGTARVVSTYAAALERLFERGDRLKDYLETRGVGLGELEMRWESLRREWRAMDGLVAVEDPGWEDLWRRAHQVRRAIVFSNPETATGPLLFVKQVPGIFSHQLTQYYGSCALPGGGLFVLDDPGRSLASRPLAEGLLPQGSFQHPEVSPDGRRVLFAYCRVDSPPTSRESHLDRFYHLYEIGADGSALRQVTGGSFDDFSPRYLPDGDILFVSTRRGGFHRCGRGPCPTYTLARVKADGTDPRPISYHETHEWDPVLLNDGHILYTRWDYVDRHAVFYQQLWTKRPDGTGVAAFYGNNTFNPVGVWEARPVPGSSRIMATAGAHHAMTAGSIILIDVTRGREGLDPITRLTPEVLFPESEAPVANLGRAAAWCARLEGDPLPWPVEMQRWPGHCYRSPFPLSETCFLAAYSYETLIGEPDPNPAAMFGLYVVDRFGNKELLHRDPEISSLWPVPLRPWTPPPMIASTLEAGEVEEGFLVMQDIRESWPPLPAIPIQRLRILQVLPKSTWNINDPPVGLANASPGRQVLGTVPVERDGSAFFRAPARVPLAFQALDEMGRAVQTMRSIVYLQPGETASCIGCHESRQAAPPRGTAPLALARDPSRIEPGPDGSRPFSYPLLVQPVLDRHCVPCHNPDRREGNVLLTGAPEGRFTASYNALAGRVPHAAWGGQPGDFRIVNSEPVTQPGFFGARNSPLLRQLLEGHQEVELAASDLERLITWMDANALFYGTFDPADQARQLRGEAIAGPALE